MWNMASLMSMPESEKVNRRMQVAAFINVPVTGTPLPNALTHTCPRTRRVRNAVRHGLNHNEYSHATTHGTIQRRPVSMTLEEDEDKNKENETDDMTLYQNIGRQRRGMQELPFDVSIISPPPRYLGRFQLDPSTHCGDIFEHDGNHFEVKVVRLRYKFSQGRYRVVGKKIEVKSLARKAIEVYLEQKFKQS